MKKIIMKVLKLHKDSNLYCKFARKKITEEIIKDLDKYTQKIDSKIIKNIEK
jgi:hypothetical protein